MDEHETLTDLAAAVKTLAEGVADMQKNMIDRETVERMAETVVARQRAAAPFTGRAGGFQPADDADDEPTGPVVGLRERAAIALEREAPKAAAALRRPVEDVREFQRAADDLLLLAAIKNVDPRSLDYFTSEFQPRLRALDTATAGEGQEYVPTILSSSFIERVALELRVAALFPSINMPSPTFDLPGLAVSRQRTFGAAQSTADVATAISTRDPATRKVTLTAVKFAVRALVSREAEEDAIIAMLPFMQSELVDYMAADVEDVILNGDTTGTQDTDSAAAGDPRLLWSGLRKNAQAAAKTDAANADLTVPMLRTNRFKMGKYGVSPGKLAHVLSIASYIKLLSDANLITMDKYGPQATVVTGELAKADGVPVIVSEYQRDNLNATGVFDNVTTNRSSAQTVFTGGWMLGLRRGVTVQVLKELYAATDQDGLVITSRRAFSPLYPVASNNIVANTYNLKAV